MNKFDWRATAELIGIGALVLSLIFVGYELRQSRVIARIEAHTSSSSSWVDARDSINLNADVWLRGAAGEELSDTESVVFENLVRNVNEQAISAYRTESELGNEPAAELSLHDFAAFLHQNPGARRVWFTREENLNRYRETLSPESGDLWSFWQERILEDLERLDAMAE